MLGSISYPPIPLLKPGSLPLSLRGLLAGFGFPAGAWLVVREGRRRGHRSDAVVPAPSWALTPEE